MILGLAACAWIGPAELADRFDQDGDGHDAAQFDGDDCRDDRADIHPGAEDVPDDGVDQDCADGDATSPPGHTGDSAVVVHSGHVAHSGLPGEGDCEDELDGDDDGLIDCLDPECQLEVSCDPVVSINEIFAAPKNGLLSDVGDANCDGRVSPDQDEFVELVNVGPSPVTLAGAELSDTDTVRFTFGQQTTPMMPGDVVVVFGGGTWGKSNGDLVNAGPWCRDLAQTNIRVFFATNGLGFARTTDEVTLVTSDGTFDAAWSNAPEGQSYTRFPDLSTGPFVNHESVTVRECSPGRKVDSSLFDVAADYPAD